MSTASATLGDEMNGTREADSKLDDALQRACSDLASGDLAALDRIWRLIGDDLYALALWRTASSADAEDAVQEVFVRLARRPAVLRKVKKPRPYLLRMLRNAGSDIASSRRESNLGDEVPELIQVGDDVEAQFDGRTASAALHQLKPAQREVILLRHVWDLSFREMAEITGVPTFTAASRYRLGIGRLQSILGVKP